MRDEIEKLTAAGARPFGVNPASAESHARYADRLSLPFALLSDPDRSIAEAYRAVKEDGQGIQRSVYAIAADGRIVYAVRGTPPISEVAASLGG